MKKLPKSGASGALKDQQFECVKCDPACASCSGQGPLMCTEVRVKFTICSSYDIYFI